MDIDINHQKNEEPKFQKRRRLVLNIPPPLSPAASMHHMLTCVSQCFLNRKNQRCTMFISDKLENKNNQFLRFTTSSNTQNLLMKDSPRQSVLILNNEHDRNISCPHLKVRPHQHAACTFALRDALKRRGLLRRTILCSSSCRKPLNTRLQVQGQLR